VHNHWTPYYTLEGVLHALCDADHLRALKALVEIEREDWARKIQRLLRLVCHATNLARDLDVPLKPSRVAMIERFYDSIVAEGIAFHETQPGSAAARAGRRGPLP
jgi:transposase